MKTTENLILQPSKLLHVPIYFILYHKGIFDCFFMFFIEGPSESNNKKVNLNLNTFKKCWTPQLLLEQLAGEKVLYILVALSHTEKCY